MQASVLEKVAEVRDWMTRAGRDGVTPSDDDVWAFIVGNWKGIPTNEAESLLGEAMKPVPFGPHRIIRISYAVYEPDHEGDAAERGWINETGEKFDNVLEAAVYLTDEGAVHPSSSQPEARMWFDSADDEDYTTGRLTVRSFHPSGFSATELATLHAVVERMPPLGLPDMLDYCYVDDLAEFASRFVVDDTGTIISSDDGRFVGAPLAAAYVESFGYSDGTSPWTAGSASDEYLVLGSNDSVYFNAVERPVLVRRNEEGSVAYSFEPSSYFPSDSVDNPSL